MIRLQWFSLKFNRFEILLVMCLLCCSCYRDKSNASTPLKEDNVFRRHRLLYITSVLLTFIEVGRFQLDNVIHNALWSLTAVVTGHKTFSQHRIGHFSPLVQMGLENTSLTLYRLLSLHICGWFR